MKTFLTKISPFLLIAALAFSANLSANNIVDREPTSVEFLEGKVYRLSVQLEEVKFQLKDRSLAKLEKKKLKLKKRQLKRELNYNMELLSHARYPVRYSHPGPWRYYNYRPITVPRRRAYCPPSYRRPVVIVNQNRNRGNRGNGNARSPQPRRTQATPRASTPRRQSPGVVTPRRKSRDLNASKYTPSSNRSVKVIKR